jgi:hypothetical protein
MAISPLTATSVYNTNRDLTVSKDRSPVGDGSVTGPKPDGGGTGTPPVTALPWSGITDTPTTLAGYGITDAIAGGPQVANTVLAGPTSGADADPTFRAIAVADLPDISSGLTGTLPVANGGTGTTTPSLVAGTNVTVTGTWPNQTIASSGGGGTTTLADLACVQCWYGPDSAALTSVGAPAANGDLVKWWKDRSKWLRHLVQGTATSQPTFVANLASTGLAAVKFPSGSTRNLQSGLVTNFFAGGLASDLTLFVVRQCSGTTGFHPLFSFSYSDSNRLAVYTSSTSGEQWRANRGASSVTYTGFAQSTSLQLLELQIRSSSFLFRINDVTVSTLSDASAGMGSVATNIVLGSYAGLALGSDLNLGEVVILDGSASSTDVSNVRTDIMTRWGL